MLFAYIIKQGASLRTKMEIRMKKIEMRKITELNGFRAGEFSVRSYDYGIVNGVTKEEDPDEFEAAKRSAEEVDGICIAVIHDELGEYTFVEPLKRGGKFVLFNAAETSRNLASVHAVTRNTGLGARTNYWYEKWLRYQKGGLA